MSGLMQSTFQNFKKFPKMIDVDVLVVGSGGAGYRGAPASATYVEGLYYNETTYLAGGRHNGGNAGYSGMVVSGQTKMASSYTYSITIAPGGYLNGGNGSSSYIYGPFPDSVSSSMVKTFTDANAGGGNGGIGGFFGVIGAGGGYGGIFGPRRPDGPEGVGGGALTGHAFPPVYLGASTSSTVFASNISGTNSYYGNGNTGGGLSAGYGPAPGLAGAVATNYGQGGGGGYGGAYGVGSYSQLYPYNVNSYSMSRGGDGANGKGGIAIIRCRQSDFVSYTRDGQSQPASYATTSTSNGIVYSIFTFTGNGTITFHST